MRLVVSLRSGTEHGIHHVILLQKYLNARLIIIVVFFVHRIALRHIVKLEHGIKRKEIVFKRLLTHQLAEHIERTVVRIPVRIITCPNGGINARILGTLYAVCAVVDCVVSLEKLVRRSRKLGDAVFGKDLGIRDDPERSRKVMEFIPVVALFQ